MRVDGATVVIDVVDAITGMCCLLFEFLVTLICSPGPYANKDVGHHSRFINRSFISTTRFFPVRRYAYVRYHNSSWGRFPAMMTCLTAVTLSETYSK